jgi:NADH dehydrogenase
VDRQTRQVLLDDGAATFDYLVLAVGLVSAFAGVPGAAAHAISLKLVTTRPGCGTGCCARSKPQPPSRARRSPARPASPSSAAARPASSCPATSPASCSATSSKPDYPQLDPAAMRVTLLKRGDRLLPGSHPALSGYALKTLHARGMDVRLGTEVAGVDGDGVTIGGRSRCSPTTRCG